MANVEIYDYVSTVSADNNQTLAVTPQNVIIESGKKNVIIHTGDDESESRIILSAVSVFYVTLTWPTKSSSDIGTLLQFYHDAAYGNGRAESFKWTHPTDGHTYVVRFESDVERQIMVSGLHGIVEVRLKVLGRIVDA